MVQSDALSCRPDFVPDNDTDNDDMTMLSEKLFINLIDTDLQNRIANCKAFDKDATNALTTLLEQGPTMVQNALNDWTMEEFEGNTVLFYKGKNYIPQDQNIRCDIAKMFHDNETAGHPGELETYNSIRHHYWWPGMRTYVKNYIKGCGTCQQFKIDRQPSKPSFIPTEGTTTTRPFANCLIVVDQGLSKG